MSLTGYTGDLGKEDVEWGTGLDADTFTVPSHTSGSDTKTKIPSPYAGTASIIKGCWYLNNTAAVDHSNASVEGSMAWIVTTLAGADCTVFVPAGTYVFSGNYTIPATITLEVQRGASLNPATTKTLTINAAINAGRYQIFGGAGTIAAGVLPWTYPEWFGAVIDDNTVDSGAAWNLAIAATKRHGRVIPIPGTYYLATGILVDENPLSIVGDATYGTVFSPKTGLADWTAMMTVNSTVRGLVPNWWTSAHNNGFKLGNVTFEGGGRDYQCHGLVFTGKNSDVQLENIFFSNIKGSGMKACDPFGTTHDDAVTGNLMQQCQFYNMRFQNCGYEATGGTASQNYAASHAAYEIGRNDVGSGSHNHLKHTGPLQIGYSRWRGLRILNRAGAGETGPNIHQLYFDDLFLHGTTSLAGNDENGVAWQTDQHLMTIGNIPSAPESESSADTNYNQGEIKTVFVTKYNIAEMEDGYAGIVVGECWNGAGADVGASIHMDHGQFSANNYLTPAYGVMFDGAESSYVGGITYHSPGGPANSVYIRSLLDSLQEITLGPMTAEVPTGTPAASATKYIVSDIGFGQIHDLTAQVFTARVQATGKDVTGDTDGATGEITGMADTSRFIPGSRVMVSAGFLTTGPHNVLARTLSTIVIDVNSTGVVANVTVNGLVKEFALVNASTDYKFIKGAWIVPEGKLVANDTDYAELKIGYRNNAGTVGTGSPVTTTTKTSASGGTGNFVAFTRIELDVDRGVAYLPIDGTVTFEIDQVAAGVATPAMLVGFEVSDWKYYQDP